jgi:hypothetical protein
MIKSFDFIDKKLYLEKNNICLITSKNNLKYQFRYYIWSEILLENFSVAREFGFLFDYHKGLNIIKISSA